MSEKHPLVTFALLAYNQEEYIREAVTGALAQDYPNMEVILSDDCSTDRTYELMQGMAAAYNGPHNVRVMRADQNKGLACHFDHIMGLAKGEIVALAAGDDISLSSRVSDAVAALRTDSSLMFVSFSDDVIDGDGRFVKSLARQKSEKRLTLMDYLAGAPVPVSGASRVFKKLVFDYFGNISQNCPTEDSVMAIRSLMLGDGLVLPKAGIRYRWHGGNLSGAAIHAMNFSEIFEQYLRDVATFRSRINHGDFERDGQCLAVIEWAERNIRIRKLKAYLHSAARWSPVSYWRIACNPDISVRQKLVLSFRHLLSRS